MTVFSVLQIVDGGLNNISKTVDRLSTLATQSASATFSGNRDTLNQEFQSLLGEITRQANNIGLSVGGKYNTVNTVFIGGGNTARRRGKHGQRRGDAGPDRFRGGHQGTWPAQLHVPGGQQRGNRHRRRIADQRRLHRFGRQQSRS